MSKELNTLFMGFAKGSSTVDAVAKRYIGVGSVWIKGVCPTKAELEEFWGVPQKEDPKYLDEIEIDGQKCARVRIDILAETDPNYNDGISTKQRVSYYITNKEVRSADGKIQVIDRFGQTAYATEEELKVHSTIFTKKDGTKYQSTLDEGYWVARRGEADMVALIKAFCRIPDVVKWENNMPAGRIDNPEDAEARFEDIGKIIKGDFTEVIEAIGHQPTNKVKLGFGVRTTDDNKLYQAFFTAFPMKNGVTDYSKFAKKVADAKAAGGYANTEFEACPLKEYVVAPTEAPAAPTATPMNWFKKD